MQLGFIKEEVQAARCRLHRRAIRRRLIFGKILSREQAAFRESKKVAKQVHSFLFHKAWPSLHELQQRIRPKRSLRLLGEPRKLLAFSWSTQLAQGKEPVMHQLWAGADTAKAWWAMLLLRKHQTSFLVIFELHNLIKLNKKLKAIEKTKAEPKRNFLKLLSILISSSSTNLLVNFNTQQVVVHKASLRDQVYYNKGKRSKVYSIKILMDIEFTAKMTGMAPFELKMNIRTMLHMTQGLGCGGSHMVDSQISHIQARRSARTRVST